MRRICQSEEGEARSRAGAEPSVEPAASGDSGVGMNLDQGHWAVVGLQWGDEGKGQIVDWLASRFEVVCRFNGGNNAGHSVHVGPEKFALHLLPSGIIHPKVRSVIANGVVVDPSTETGILKEIDALSARGFDVGQNLCISDRAHVVMPYHRVEDALYSAASARHESTDRVIGTTGRGIGPCYADKAQRCTAIRMGDLRWPDLLDQRLEHIVKIKNAVLGALARQADQPFEPFDVQRLSEQLRQWAERLRPCIGDTRRLLLDAQRQGRQILFEGANAALLDVDHGTYPFVTSSSTAALGIGPGTGLAGGRDVSVIGVAKAYTTRVGGGPHPTEQVNEVGEHLQHQGKEFGTTTGRARRCGYLDLTALRYTAQLNGANALVVTGLAVLAGLRPLRLCVGYRTGQGGEISEDFPSDAQVLSQVQPVYETLTGFDQAIDTVRSYDQLPDQAKQYVRRIEAFVGVPVKIVCVGPRRDQTLFR